MRLDTGRQLGGYFQAEIKGDAAELWPSKEEGKEGIGMKNGKDMELTGFINGAEGGGIKGEEKKKSLLSCLSKGVSSGVFCRDKKLWRKAILSLKGKSGFGVGCVVWIEIHTWCLPGGIGKLMQKVFAGETSLGIPCSIRVGWGRVCSMPSLQDFPN